MRPECQSSALVRRLGVVGFDEAGADEEQVADLDGAAGGGRADVDALGGAAGLELGVGNGVAVVRVWVLLALYAHVLLVGSIDFSGTIVDPFALCVGSVVQQDPAAGDAVVGPVMDAVSQVGVWAFDVFPSDAVIELGGAEIAHVSESVPLSPFTQYFFKKNAPVYSLMCTYLTECSYCTCRRTQGLWQGF